MAMMNKLEFGLWRWAKIGQKGSKSWYHVTFQGLQNDDLKGNASENGKVKPPEGLSAWVARWADRTGCQVVQPSPSGTR